MMASERTTNSRKRPHAGLALLPIVHKGEAYDRSARVASYSYNIAEEAFTAPIVREHDDP